MELEYFAGTHPGQVRKRNEDTYVADPAIGLYLVADGMGGHARGDEASRVAALTVHETIKKGILSSLEFQEKGTPEAKQKVYALLRDAVSRANMAVFGRGWSSRAKEIMGTTLTGILISGTRAFVFHVGDSRVYLFRNGRVHLITADDSLFFRLLKAGGATKGQERSFPYKNIMTKAVGVRQTVEPLIMDFPLLPGDRILICSDGLYGYFTDQELAQIMKGSKASTMVQEMIKRALERGGEDNITGIVIKFSGKEVLSPQELESQQAVEAISREPLFSGLSLAELFRLQSKCEVRNYKVGELIFRQGEKAEDFFIVISGSLEIQRDGKVVAVVSSGEHFGELSLVSAGKRMATGMAVEALRLFIMKRSVFLETIREDPLIGVKLLWNLSSMLSDRLKRAHDELSLLRTMVEHQGMERFEFLSSDFLEEVEDED